MESLNDCTLKAAHFNKLLRVISSNLQFLIISLCLISFFSNFITGVESANMAPNAKFSSCANRTFACIEGSDLKQTYCCCSEIYNTCKKELFCSESTQPSPKKSIPKPIQQESCRYLGKQDPLFRNKGKANLQKCNSLPEQCSTGAVLTISGFSMLFITSLGLVRLV